MSRPEKVNNPHVLMGAKKKVREVSHKISAKHLMKVKDNADLKPCCRKAEDHDVEFMKSASNETDQPDVMVMTCDCGCRHITIGSTGEAKAEA
jgi:hypothetical protein